MKFYHGIWAVLVLLVLTAVTARAELPVVVGDKYVVKAGDTLGALAKSFGMTLKALQFANPGIDADHLKVGQVIKVPSEAGGLMGRLGVDYARLVEAARSDKAALPLFMAQHRLMDGAAAEEFSADLGALLKLHGDAAFAEALAVFSRDMQQGLLVEVLFDAGIEVGGKNWNAFRDKYPKTAALVILTKAHVIL